MAYPRTGANYLCDVLNSHSSIRLEKDLFSINLKHKNKREVASRCKDPVGYLRQYSSPKQVHGFKLFPRFLKFSLIESMLKYFRATVRVVVVSRADLLAAYVSDRIAKTTAAYQNTSNF